MNKNLKANSSLKKILFTLFINLIVATSASATTFTWDFGFTGASIFFGPVTGSDYHFGSNSALSSSTLVYDDVTGNAVITVMGTGDVVNSADGSVIVTATNFAYQINFTGVTGDPLASDLSITTPGTGIYNIANVGNIDGIAGNDSISGELVTHSNFIILSSSVGEGINNAAWFNRINDILVNGVESNALFNTVGGDLDLNFGALLADTTEVPEPSSLALFGIAGLFGAIKKRKK